jgi:uncharacterized phage protein gp47/JayE
MPYARPTLTALRDQSINDITTSGVPNLDGLLRNAVLRVLAWVMAGLSYSVYGYLDWIALQAVPFTATDEFLEGWAALIGVYRKDATAASGSVQFTLGQPGTFVASGTAMTRQDAVPYQTTEDATVDPDGTLTVAVEAEVVGAMTDCDAGTPIGFATPIVGIPNNGVVLAPGCTGGADQEEDPDFRTRMLAEYRNPPQGGSTSDYIIWSLQVPGVTRAWVEPNGMGAGTVVVRFMLDEAQAAHGGFPQGTNGCALEETRGPPASGDQLAVAEHIWPLQPVTALVFAMAPGSAPIDVALQNLDPDTPDMLASITAAIDDMLLAVGSPGGTVYPSDIYNAILAAPGIQHFTMVEPSAPFTAPPGALPVMGNLTASAL